MRKIGPYVYSRRPIGKGQYAFVYKGYHRKSKRPVAVKIYLNVKNGKKEAEIMNRLKQHQHIVRFRQFYIVRGRAFTVMNWVNGRPLGTRRSKRWIGQKHSIPAACSIVIKLLRAMRYMHARNIQYRDVNPSNILVSGKSLKIVDFGSSIQNQKSHVLLDLYLAGYLLYFLIHGNIRAYRRKFPLIRPKVNNRKLQRVLTKALHPNKRMRYQNANQFIRALIPFVKKR